ncbi:GHKL domain-containing protein [Caproicibacterium sp. XB2]|uniref:GHKL domain-containing protein n=1 Tax=Caproicibacterium sp. XB2 TaxID=3388458 RepID=UPI00384B9002
MEWLQLIQYRISMAFLLTFLYFFLPMRYTKPKTILLLLLCFLVTSPGDYAQCFLPDQILPATLLEILVLQLFVLLLCLYRDWRAVMTGIMAACYVLPGNVLCSMLYYYGSIVGKNPDYTSAAFAFTVQIVVHAVFLLLLILFCRKQYLSVIEDSRIHWGGICLSLALYYVVVCTMMVWPTNFYKYPQKGVPILLMLAAMIFTYFFVFNLVSAVKQSEKLKHNNELLEAYAAALKREVEHEKKSKIEMAILRHDMRHSANLVFSYLENGDTDKIRGMLQQYVQRLDHTVVANYCKNTAVNGVLTAAAEFAEKKKVQFQCRADVPKQLQVNEFELLTVLLNLLENAVNAAANVKEPEKRFVHVLMHPAKDKTILEITNSYAGTVTFSHETGLPESTRGEGHGYGLRQCTGIFQEKPRYV